MLSQVISIWVQNDCAKSMGGQAWERRPGNTILWRCSFACLFLCVWEPWYTASMWALVKEEGFTLLFRDNCLPLDYGES